VNFDLSEQTAIVTGGATGIGEAIKELKDCLRDELPDE